MATWHTVALAAWRVLVVAAIGVLSDRVVRTERVVVECRALLGEDAGGFKPFGSSWRSPRSVR